jgi:hypothetical protein
MNERVLSYELGWLKNEFWVISVFDREKSSVVCVGGHIIYLMLL